MRILYLHQFFMTRAGGGGTRSYEFARHLVGAGHEVTMVTAARRRPAATVDGIDVVEVGGAYSDYVRRHRHGLRPPDRGASGASPPAPPRPRCARRAPTWCSPPRPPLTIALPGDRRRAAATARRWCSRCATCGRGRRSRWARCATRVARRGRAGARARASTAPPRTWWRSRRGCATAWSRPAWRPSGSTLIPNASDLDLFSPDVDPGDLRERLGLEDAFVCSYFGTMGEANDLTQVVEAAALLRDRGENGVAFVLQGEGKRRAADRGRGAAARAATT